MQKRTLTVLVCLIMVLNLLSTTALATDRGTAGTIMDGLAIEGLEKEDTFAVGAVTYTYGGDVSASSLDLVSYDVSIGWSPLTGNRVWKAGSGYILYSYNGSTAAVTLHNAIGSGEIVLPYSRGTHGGDKPTACNTTVTLEGDSFLSGNLDHQSGATSFTGSGSLTAAKPCYLHGAVTVTGGAQVKLEDNYVIVCGLLTVEDGATLTMTANTLLDRDNDYHSDIYPGGIAVSGGTLVNNGTIVMAAKTAADPGITGDIAGSGVVKFGSVAGAISYIKAGGEWVVYGGDVSEKGLDISTRPDVETTYRAGTGTIVFTPAADGETPTLTLNNATTKGITLKGSYTLALNGSNRAEMIDLKTVENADELTVTAAAAASLTAQYISAGSVTGAASALNTITITGPDGGRTFTFYGTNTFTGTGAQASAFVVDAGATVTVNGDNVVFKADSTFTNKGKIVINSGKTLNLSECTSITSTGSVENNGVLTLPDSTTGAQISELNLTGNGTVKAGDKTFTNGGEELIKRDSGLDFTGADGFKTDATLDDDGYSYACVTNGEKKSYTITLGNLLIDVEAGAAIKLPNDGDVTVVLATGKTTRINSGSSCGMEFRGAGDDFRYTIKGSGNLEIRSSNAAGSIQTANSLTVAGGDIAITNDADAGSGIDAVVDSADVPTISITGGKLNITAKNGTIKAKNENILGSGMKVTSPEGAKVARNGYDSTYYTIVGADYNQAASVVIQPAPTTPPAPAPAPDPVLESSGNDDNDDTPSPVTVYNDPMKPNATVWLTGSNLDSGDLLITERDPEGSAYQALMELADSGDVFATYNVYLRSGKKSTGSAMDLAFTLNAKYAGQDFTLVHQKGDGAYEYFYDTADANGDLSFGPLYELSPFMLVKGTLTQSPITIDEDVPKTGDSAQSVLWAGAVLMTAVMLAGIALRKRHRDCTDE